MTRLERPGLQGILNFMSLSKKSKLNHDYASRGANPSDEIDLGFKGSTIITEKFQDFLLNLSGVKTRSEIKQAILNLSGLIAFSNVNIVLTDRNRIPLTDFFEDVHLSHPDNFADNLFCGEQVLSYPISHVFRDKKQAIKSSKEAVSWIAGILFPENLPGYIYFEGGGFTGSDFYVIKLMAVPVSNAVANVLINERNHEHENERVLLLDLTTAIAAISDKKGIQKLINNNFKALFEGMEFIITIVNEHNQQQYLYLGDNHVTLPGLYIDWDGESGTQKNALDDLKPVSVKSSALLTEMTEMAINNGTPLVMTWLQFHAINKIPVTKSGSLEPAETELLISGLGDQERKFGLLIMIANNGIKIGANQIGLIKWISSQLTVVIKNIWAREEIYLREIEKSVLLAFSNEIALVRDKVGLDVVIGKMLEKLFETNEYIITIKDEEKRIRSFYLHYLVSPLINSEKFKKIVETPLAFSDKLAELVFASDKPVKVDLDEEVRERNLNLPNADFFRSMNISSLSGMALKAGNKDIGILWIRSENTKERLLIDVAPQIATAIANIRVNEKIQSQLLELSGFKQQLEVENLYLQEEIETTHNYSEIVGSSRNMSNLFHLVSQVAGTSSSVLILGETGTGKELIARAIHNTSPRRDKLMVKINCATLPPNLIESELFGHERGSFTGATERRIGKFELANNSTLFLDEIGELPLDLQVKLLRALQEKEIERVGGKTVIKTNVRIIAATNRDLKQEVKLGNFRSDLYFRLNVFPIIIPPLRDRKDDINLLAAHFLNKHAKKGGKKIIGLSSKALKQLNSYDWPGNVRELEHLIERSILLTTKPVITNIDLPSPENIDGETHLSVNRIKTIDEVEREHILYVLQRCNGKVSGVGGAAQALNIPSTTLGSKIKRLGITKEFTSE